ncbi:MAG TPA: glycosyltransferase family 4 protein [Herpetosiphonaceae bacterium]|nr:glycosyltransferase family 4 protein [Herpetosiphonaceae bacterium]
MRILMLNNEFPPLGGGTGTVNQALLERFAQVPDIEIDLITSALGKRKERELFADRINVLKVPVNNRNIHHSSNRELLTYAARALPAALKLHRTRPYDFCFAWSAVPAGGVALALRGLARLPYLVRVCGPDIPGFERRYGALYPILSPAIRAIWHGAEVVVAKCEGEADQIRAVDRRIDITLVPNGVNLAAFHMGDGVPDTGALRLICVARLIERKGQHHLIEAVKHLADKGISVMLDLVGTGDAQAANEAQVRALGLTEQVRFVGYVPREEIPAHYAAAHVFVLPSYNEGMSVATLEAMAAGLPVVVTRTGGTAELVEDGVNGLTFDWSDVETLTAHLHRLAADRPLVRRMGAASRIHAARFSWDAAARQYLELFTGLAAPRDKQQRPAPRHDTDANVAPLREPRARP